MGLAIFLLVVCGLVGILYFVATRRGMSPDEPEKGRDRNQRHFRDSGPPGW